MGNINLIGSPMLIVKKIKIHAGLCYVYFKNNHNIIEKVSFASKNGFTVQSSKLNQPNKWAQEQSVCRSR